MTLTSLVAEEIRAMMARRRLSGQQLARTLGVSNAWVSYRLSGKQAIDLNDLERIAMVLEVHVQDLLPSRDELDARRQRPRTAKYDYLRPGELNTRPRGRRDFTRPGELLVPAA